MFISILPIPAIIRNTFIIHVAVLIVFNLCGATVLRVPSDYNTIQSALNASFEGDTILIALGIYAEALQGPPHSFFLKGDVVQDTGDYARPIIDPSTLPNPTVLNCLTTSSVGISSIENIIFRNSSPMFPRSGNIVGGIINNNGNFTVKKCIFDSTYIGIWSLETPINLLEDCQFRNNSRTCVYMNGASITANNCVFSGRGAIPMVAAGSHSRFNSCRFSDNDQAELLVAGVTDIIIENCIFGPYGPFRFSPVSGTMANSLIQNNLFIDCLLGSTVLALNCVCDSPTVVRSNHFLRNESVRGFGFGGSQLHDICYDEQNLPCFGVIIENNLFENCVSFSGGKAVNISALAEVNHNRFQNMQPDSFAVVLDNFSGNIYQNNFFQNNGYALQAQNSRCDARDNWWGDSTGPYHPNLNSHGLGDRVSDSVSFAPWYTDTAFFNLSSDEPRNPRPSSFTLSTYPNPFNSSTEIRYELRSQEKVKLSVYDILGREVKELVNEVQSAGEHRVVFEGKGLGSGIYFARLEITPPLSPPINRWGENSVSAKIVKMVMLK